MGETGESREHLAARLIGGTKYIMILAVIGIFLGAMALLISSAVQMYTSVYDIFGGDPDYHELQLRLDLIEAVDTVLVATVLYMIAVGLYQLFINARLELPAWLQTRGLIDLETRLASMVVTVLSVIFVTVALESRGEKEILDFGAAIAAIIVAIGIFQYQEGKHRDKNGERYPDPEGEEQV